MYSVAIHAGEERILSLQEEVGILICAFAMKNVEGMEEQSQSKLTMRVLSLQLHVIKL